MSTPPPTWVQRMNVRRALAPWRFLSGITHGDLVQHGVILLFSREALPSPSSPANRQA